MNKCTKNQSISASLDEDDLALCLIQTAEKQSSGNDGGSVEAGVSKNPPSLIQHDENV